eukprot:scaffold121869_cov45-Phaeocystis_antarctica.AAC.1
MAKATATAMAEAEAEADLPPDGVVDQGLRRLAAPQPHGGSRVALVHRRPATVGTPGCNRTRASPATVATPGCNRSYSGLQPYVAHRLKAPSMTVQRSGARAISRAPAAAKGEVYL